MSASDVTCPLCLREIPRGKESRHHLVPKLKGGKHEDTVVLCSSCHSKIHSVLTEAELARSYATVEALQGHPEIAKFAGWIGKKPPGFRAHSRSLRKKK